MALFIIDHLGGVILRACRVLDVNEIAPQEKLLALLLEQPMKRFPADFAVFTALSRAPKVALGVARETKEISACLCSSSTRRRPQARVRGLLSLPDGSRTRTVLRILIRLDDTYSLSSHFFSTRFSPASRLSRLARR
jgi:hypothetical protein